MSRHIVALLFAAVALAFMAPGAKARPIDQVTASGSLRVAVYRDYAPFASGKGEKLAGVDVDLGAAIAKRLGVKVDYMVLTAGESVDDDLRNGVWKGHYLGGGVADLMLHVPVDQQLALRNDNAVIFGPYYREQVVVLLDPTQTSGNDLVNAFGEHKIGVELDSLADFYLTSAFGGVLRNNVVHYRHLEEAVAAVRRGEVAGVMGPRSEVEGALHGKPGHYRVAPMPTPGLFMSSWPIGMAVKVNSHDLANSVEMIVEKMIHDGTLAKIFRKHGLSYVSPES